MKSSVWFVAGALALGLAAASAAAETTVVEAGGSIQAAVDAAASGDTIVVAGGTFEENVTVSGRTDLRIVARGRAVIEAASDSSAAVTIEGSEDVRFSGFTVLPTEHDAFRFYRLDP